MNALVERGARRGYTLFRSAPFSDQLPGRPYCSSLIDKGETSPVVQKALHAAFALKAPQHTSPHVCTSVGRTCGLEALFLSRTCGCWCGRSSKTRAFHVSSLVSQMENQAAGNPSGGSELPPGMSFTQSQEPTSQHLHVRVYEKLKDYVMKKHANKPEFLKLLDDYNPFAQMEEPSIEDFRPPNRELPPLDRVTIALETEDQYRVTRKTKWVIKQLRSPLMDDVPALLEQWVKTMYPKRSDWLDLLKEFSNEKEQELLFQIFEFALFEDTFEVRSQDVTKILVKYMNLERYDDVDRLMSTLDSKAFPPDFVICTLMLDMNCKLKRLDKAREMYDRIQDMGYTPDVTACTKLIDFYCDSGNPEVGEMLLEEMEDDKVHPTVGTYLAVLKGYGKLGKASEAMRIFRIVKDDGFLRNKIGSDMYSALMDAYTQANMLKSAVLTMEQMLLGDLQPEDESVALLITAYEKKNQFQKALDVLLKLESLALRPGPATLTQLIGWFGKLGLIEEAEILFKNIEAKVEVPDCKAYASLYSAYIRVGSLDKARDVLCSAEQKVEISGVAYEHMILSLLESQQTEEGQAMRDKMISKGLTPSDEIERALLGRSAGSLFSDGSSSKPLEAATRNTENLGAMSESFLADVIDRSLKEESAENSSKPLEAVLTSENLDDVRELVSESADDDVINKSSREESTESK